MQVIEHPKQRLPVPGLLLECVNDISVSREGCGSHILGGAGLPLGGTGGNAGHGGARPGQATDGPNPRPQRRHPGVVDSCTPADLYAIGASSEFLYETGLADPGRSADKNNMTRAGACISEPVMQERQFLPRPTKRSCAATTPVVSPPANHRYRFSTRFRISTDAGGVNAGEAGRMDLNKAVERLFTPAPQPGRVGAEVELIPVTDAARPRSVDPALLAAGFDAGFARAAGVGAS